MIWVAFAPTRAITTLALPVTTVVAPVSFKRRAETQPAVCLLPFPDGLCLVQPQP
jgi:hypothetical protein